MCSKATNIFQKNNPYDDGDSDNDVGESVSIIFDASDDEDDLSDSSGDY
jgi:hypothetical protein